MNTRFDDVNARFSDVNTRFDDLRADAAAQFAPDMDQVAHTVAGLHAEHVPHRCGRRGPPPSS